jgi:hypothetical protein
MLTSMGVGMGVSELVIILVIVVVVFGATRLPPFGERSEGSPPQSSRWTRYDWILLVAAIVSVSIAVALEIFKSRAT